MHSRKTIENIYVILAELTHSQYSKWLSDSLEQSEMTMRDLVKFRQNDTFKKIFGNQRRIFIPFEVKKDAEESSELKNNAVSKIRQDPLNAFPNINYTWPKVMQDVKKIYRIYFDLENQGDGVEQSIAYRLDRYDNDLQKQILEYIDMYVNGYIINIHNGKKEKFGKFVQKMIDMLNKQNVQLSDSKIEEYTNSLAEILKRFNERNDWLNQDVVATFSDKPQKWYAVISNDPQDVGAMSTGQGWTSCQNLDKHGTGSIVYTDYNWHTLYDVPKGTCVAYLLSPIKWRQSQKDFINNRTKWQEENSNKIYFKNAPIKGASARIAIKPFYGIDNNNKGRLYLSIGDNPKIYGTTPIEKYFVQIVNDFLIDKQVDISGKFVIPSELYNEGLGDNGSSIANIVIVNNGTITGLEGKNRMLGKRPFAINRTTSAEWKEQILSTHIQNLDNIEYFESEDNKLVLFASVFSNFTFENYDDICVIAAHFDECEFSGINMVANKNSNLHANIAKETFAMKVFNRYLPKDFQEKIEELLSGYPDIYSKYTSIFNKTLTSYAKQNNLDTIVFNNCNFTYNYKVSIENEGIAINNCSINRCVNVILDCADLLNMHNNTFDRSNITIDSCTIRAFPDDGQTSNNSYTYSDIIVIDKKHTDGYLYFLGDSFTHCTIDTTNYNKDIYFVDCTINGNFLEGTYVLSQKVKTDLTDRLFVE